MSIIIRNTIGYFGDPNNVLDGPKGSQFYKTGSLYKINYSGSVASGWENLYFQQLGIPTYSITSEDLSLNQISTGSFLYVKTTKIGNKNGWTLLSNKSPLIRTSNIPTPTPTNTPTPTPTNTPTPTPTNTLTSPTSTPTPTPTATPTPTPHPTCPERPLRPTPTPTPTATPTPTPTATPTPTPTPTATPTPTPTNYYYGYYYGYGYGGFGGSESFP